MEHSSRVKSHENSVCLLENSKTPDKSLVTSVYSKIWNCSWTDALVPLPGTVDSSEFQIIHYAVYVICLFASLGKRGFASCCLSL